MLKRIVGWFVLVPLCAVLILFALANRQSVFLNINPLVASDSPVATGISIPMYVVLFGVLLIGVLLGGMATWFSQGPRRRDERHFRRETERLHRELEVARRSPGGPALLGTDDFAHPN